MAYSKYRAKKVTHDNITFHSRMEGRRYLQLKSLADMGLIIWDKETPLQPKFKLYSKGQLICTYIPDFKYFDTQEKVDVVEDVKGVKTKDYIIKKKLFLAQYPEFKFIESKA